MFQWTGGCVMMKLALFTMKFEKKKTARASCASLIVFQPCLQTFALVALLLPPFMYFSSRDFTVARAT